MSSHDKLNLNQKANNIWILTLGAKYETIPKNSQWVIFSEWKRSGLDIDTGIAIARLRVEGTHWQNKIGRSTKRKARLLNEDAQYSDSRRSGILEIKVNIDIKVMMLNIWSC